MRRGFVLIGANQNQCIIGKTLGIMKFIEMLFFFFFLRGKCWLDAIIDRIRGRGGSGGRSPGIGSNPALLLGMSLKTLSTKSWISPWLFFETLRGSVLMYGFFS